MESVSVQKSWWSRNWKWAAPLGCIVPLLLCGGFIAAIVLIVFGAIRSSEVYQESLARLRADPEAVEALGTPIEEGFFVGGSIEISGPAGHADFSVPVSGPAGSGTLYVTATRSAGVWEFSILQLALEGAEGRINLLGDQ